MSTQHTVKIVEDPDQPGELLLDLGPDLCASMGWAVGDTLVWTELADDTWILTRAESANVSGDSPQQ
jgi:hypothetical protein